MIPLPVEEIIKSIPKLNNGKTPGVVNPNIELLLLARNADSSNTEYMGK